MHEKIQDNITEPRKEVKSSSKRYFEIFSPPELVVNSANPKTIPNKIYEDYK